MTKECNKCKGRAGFWEYYDTKGRRICRACWLKLSEKDKTFLKPPWWLHLIGVLFLILLMLFLGGFIGILIMILILSFAGKSYSKAKGLKENPYVAYFISIIASLGIVFVIGLIIYFMGGI